MKGATYYRKYGVSIKGDMVTTYSRLAPIGKLVAPSSTTYSPPSSSDTPPLLPPSSTTPKRECVKHFSKDSRANAKAYLKGKPKETFTRFVTLTYGYDVTPVDAHRHLNYFFKELQKRTSKHSKKPFSYFWFLEFQKSGRIHFHAFVSHYIDKLWLTAAWARISKQQGNITATNIINFNAYTKDGAANYALKNYGLKASQKMPPEWLNSTGRFWGKGGDTSTPLNLKKEVNAENREFVNEFCRLNNARELDVEFCNCFIVDDVTAAQLLMFLRRVDDG